MNHKIMAKGVVLPSEIPLLTFRPRLIAHFGLASEQEIKAKAIEELQTAMRLKKELQPFPSRDQLKVNTALAHITNAVILAIGVPKGRIWLEKICAQRGEHKVNSTPLLLLAFKAFGAYDRSAKKRRQSDKSASDDARAVLNALVLEQKLPMQLATEVFTTPRKRRSSFYRPNKGVSSLSCIKVGPGHRDRIRSRPTGAKGLGLFIRTQHGAELSGVILDPKKIAAILDYAKTLI